MHCKGAWPSCPARGLLRALASGRFAKALTRRTEGQKRAAALQIATTRATLSSAIPAARYDVEIPRRIFFRRPGIYLGDSSVREWSTQ